MQTPLPPLHETPEALKGLLKTARVGQKPRRVQARSCLQSQPVRTRRQVARLLGSRRHTVGRWLAADARGGLPQL